MKLSLDKLEWPKLSHETFVQKVRRNIILFTGVNRQQPILKQIVYSLIVFWQKNTIMNKQPRHKLVLKL